MLFLLCFIRFRPSNDKPEVRFCSRSALEMIVLSVATGV